MTKDEARRADEKADELIHGNTESMIDLITKSMECQNKEDLDHFRQQMILCMDFNADTTMLGKMLIDFIEVHVESESQDYARLDQEGN